jgi:hypothetical protein
MHFQVQRLALSTGLRMPASSHHRALYDAIERNRECCTTDCDAWMARAEGAIRLPLLSRHRRARS